MAIGYEPIESNAMNPEADAGPTYEQLIAELPKTIRVSATPHELEIREEWFRWYYAVQFVAIAIIITTIVTAAWNVDFSRLPKEEQIPGWACAIFLSIVAGGTYYSLACLMNVTTLRMNDDQLVRKVSPLPWLGYVDVAADDIDQLYVVRSLRSYRRLTPWDWDDDPKRESATEFSLAYSKKVANYKLVMRTHDRKVYSLSNEYPSPYTPRILESLIENHLGIEDAFVAEETRGMF